MTKTLSWTKAKVANDCLAQYWEKYVVPYAERRTEPPSYALERGRAIDETINTLNQRRIEGGTMERAELEGVFQSYWIGVQGVLDNRDPDAEYAKAFGMLLDLAEATRGLRVVGQQREYVAPLCNDWDFTAKIDMTYADDVPVHVDIKTTDKAPDGQKITGWLFQMRFYGAVLADADYTPTFRILAAWPGGVRWIDCNLTEQMVLAGRKHAEQTAQRIDIAEQLGRYQRVSACRFCPLRNDALGKCRPQPTEKGEPSDRHQNTRQNA